MQQFREKDLQIWTRISMLLSPPLDAMIPPGPLALLNFNPHSPTATGQLVLFFTNSSVSSRSPPNSSPSSTWKSLPPPPSTRAALGIPPFLPPSTGWWIFSRNATAGHTSCRDRRTPISLLLLLDLMWWFGMRDMGRWFRLLPLPPWRRRSNRSWTAPSAPRPPTSGALSPTGASSSRYASAVHAWVLTQICAIRGL